MTVSVIPVYGPKKQQLSETLTVAQGFGSLSGWAESLLVERAVM
jgi:hypothetical protein